MQIEHFETLVLVKGTRQAVDVIDARNLCQGTKEGKGGALSIDARDPYVELLRDPGRLEQSSDEHVDIVQLRAHGATRTAPVFHSSCVP